MTDRSPNDSEATRRMRGDRHRPIAFRTRRIIEPEHTDEWTYGDWLRLRASLRRQHRGSR